MLQGCEKNMQDGIRDKSLWGTGILYKSVARYPHNDGGFTCVDDLSKSVTFEPEDEEQPAPQQVFAASAPHPCRCPLYPCRVPLPASSPLALLTSCQLLSSPSVGRAMQTTATERRDPEGRSTCSSPRTTATVSIPMRPISSALVSWLRPLQSHLVLSASTSKLVAWSLVDSD